MVNRLLRQAARAIVEETGALHLYGYPWGLTEPVLPRACRGAPRVLLLHILYELLFINSSHGIKVELDVAFGRIVVLASTLANYLEAEDFGFIVIDLWRQDHSLLIVLKEMVREACAEEGAIDVDRAELGYVYLFASRTVNFESRHLQAVTEADWQNFLTIAEGARASTIETGEEFVVNLGHAAGTIDVPRVDQSVHVTGLLVQLQELLIRQILFVGALGAQDHLDALFEFVFAKLRLQTVQIEGVLNEVLIHLDHILMAFERAKPADPAH